MLDFATSRMPKEGRMPSYESSMRNLAKAKARWRPPRPWRSVEESRIIRRLVYLWFTSRDRRPSARAWARALGISHTWMQKLVRQFRADPLVLGSMDCWLNRDETPSFRRIEWHSDVETAMSLPRQAAGSVARSFVQHAKRYGPSRHAASATHCCSAGRTTQEA